MKKKINRYLRVTGYASVAFCTFVALNHVLVSHESPVNKVLTIAPMAIAGFLIIRLTQPKE